MSRSAAGPATARATEGRLSPVTAGKRIHVLDVLRGFALFGVLLANMIWWFSGYADLNAAASAELATAAVDGVVLKLQTFFVDAKFISIFSFLFGIGFAIQMQRAGERGAEVTALYLRRMLWLLVIGAGHMFLLWYGDILHLYAVLGLLLIGWLHRSERSLLAWGLGFVVLAPLALKAAVSGLPLLTGGVADPGSVFDARWKAVEALRTPAFKHGGYLDVVRANAAEVGAWFSTDDAVMTGVASFGKFLLGFWAGRSGLVRRAGEELDAAGRALFRRGLLWGVGLGVVCQGTLMAVEEFAPGVEDAWAANLGLDALYHVGVPAMALFYVCGVVLLFQHRAWRGPLQLFAPVGRMALTNYLGQSVVCVALFYGLGLGWYGEVGPTACVGLTVVVFLGQAAASQWWLARFRFGPAEWAWRCLAYGRLQPFRAKAT